MKNVPYLLIPSYIYLAACSDCCIDECSISLSLVQAKCVRPSSKGEILSLSLSALQSLRVSCGTRDGVDEFTTFFLSPLSISIDPPV